MDKIEIFKNDEFGQLRTGAVIDKGGVKFLFVGDEKIDKFSLLALASKYAHEDEKYAWEIMSLASKLFHPQDDFVFNELYKTVAMNIARVNSKREEHLYPKFNKNVNRLFGENAKVIKRKNHPKHQPDSWVRINGNDIPVEMKLRKFNNDALNQLKRYMDFYGCQKGIAVAEELVVKLPNNIRFISIRELEG